MTGIIERILNTIQQFWDYINPVVLVYPYENACIFTLGKISKVVKKGLYLKWPLLQTHKKQRVTTQSFCLDIATTTKDDLAIEIGCNCRFKIDDYEKMINTIEDPYIVLDEVVRSNLKKIASDFTYNQLYESKSSDRVNVELIELVQKDSYSYGVRLEACRLGSVCLNSTEIIFRRLKQMNIKVEDILEIFNKNKEKNK